VIGIRSCVRAPKPGQLWQYLRMFSNGLDGIGFQEHDRPGTVAMIDRLIWIWSQECPDGDVGVRRRLPLRHA
jgi:hypothetical protein